MFFTEKFWFKFKKNTYKKIKCVVNKKMSKFYQCIIKLILSIKTHFQYYINLLTFSYQNFLVTFDPTRSNKVDSLKRRIQNRLKGRTDYPHNSNMSESHDHSSQKHEDILTSQTFGNKSLRKSDKKNLYPNYAPNPQEYRNTKLDQEIDDFYKQIESHHIKKSEVDSCSRHDSLSHVEFKPIYQDPNEQSKINYDRDFSSSIITKDIDKTFGNLSEEIMGLNTNNYYK